MSETVFTFETVALEIERREGWLERLLQAIESSGHRLDTFVLRGPSSATHALNVKLTLRPADAAAQINAVFLALERLPGVRCSRVPCAPKMFWAGGVRALFKEWTLRPAEKARRDGFSRVALR